MLTLKNQNYFDLDLQLSNINDDIKTIYYQYTQLNPMSPEDIAKARMMAEEREINLVLTDFQLQTSQAFYILMSKIRFEYESSVDIAGGQTPPFPPPINSRPAIRRRQNKPRWCYATAAIMYAMDSGLIKEKHMHNINTYKPIMYSDNSKLRYKYCGYNAEQNFYYCDPGQEYIVELCGDDPSSCQPNSVIKAVSLLTGINVKKFGNNHNSFWLNADGTLDLKKQRYLANNLKLPAICDVFFEGDSSTEKGHSLLISNMKYEQGKVILHTEEGVFGERPVISDFSQYVPSSVYTFLSKITNIYCAE